MNAGTYWIGSASDDGNADPWEQPRQLIHIAKPFWISRYPITNAQWQVWPENTRRQLGKRDPDRSRPNQPVGQVSWDDIRAWCDWIQQETGVIVDLPTALEWEIAARGAQGTIYPWGNRWRDDRAAIGEADLRMRHSPYAPPVGCYPAGAAACGAMDMAGAIWEWTGSFMPYATLRALGVPERRLFMFPSTLTPQQRDAVQFCAIKGGAPTYIEKYARGAATIFWNNTNLISSSDRGFRIVIRQT